MGNIGSKLTLTAILVMSLTSIAAAGIPTPTKIPEPGTFGMFAGAVAIALIIAKIIKK